MTPARKKLFYTIYTSSNFGCLSLGLACYYLLSLINSIFGGFHLFLRIFYSSEVTLLCGMFLAATGLHVFYEDSEFKCRSAFIIGMVFMILTPTCWYFGSLGVGIAIYAFFVAAAFTYLFFAIFVNYNPRKWWFLWTGPLLQFEQSEQYDKAVDSLREIYTEYDYKVYGNYIKFRTSTIAVVFKLMY